jgi:hypothetical protein
MEVMGSVQANAFQRLRRPITSCRALPLRLLISAALALSLAACHHAPKLDTATLDNAGISYSAIQQLKSQDITNPEIAEVAKARQGAFSETACIQIFQIFHARGQAFDAGDAVAGLKQVGVGEDTILELARLNQLGFSAGELQAMRLAGLSDDIVLEVARRRAGGKPVLSGPSLAGMKNVGMRNTTLLELARRGVPDSEAKSIIAARRHGAKDAEILRRFSGS